jgi:hypothetical protein
MRASEYPVARFLRNAAVPEVNDHLGQWSVALSPALVKYQGGFLLWSAIVDRNRIVQANDASQILRWGTPGWVCILALLLFTLIDGLFSVLLGEKTILFLRIIESGKDSLGVAALVAGAGVPIGYLLYQIYFYIRWNWPFAAKGILFLHGRERDISETIVGVPIDRLSMSEIWRKEYIDSAGAFLDGRVADHKKAWYFLESLFLDYSSTSDAARLLYDRSRYLLDILHALGTGMFALICGGILYVAAILYLNWWGQIQNAWHLPLALSANLTLCIVLLWVFQANRDNTRAQIISLQNYLLRMMTAKSKLVADQE